jgi:transporter family protein
MNWIIYALACIFLYGIMVFFIKVASGTGNPIASSMFFISAQFLTQIILGAYFISKNNLDIDYNSIKYGIIGGVAAAGGTILYFLALQQAPISKVAPVVNMNLVIGVLLGVVLLKDAMNLRIAVGIVLAVTSIYLLTNGS